MEKVFVVYHDGIPNMSEFYSSFETIEYYVKFDIFSRINDEKIEVDFVNFVGSTINIEYTDENGNEKIYDKYSIKSVNVD